MITDKALRRTSISCRRQDGIVQLTEVDDRCDKLAVYHRRYCQLSWLMTVNRWRTIVSVTWKYDDPRLNMSHEGAARVWHVQPRVVIFQCRTNYRVSYVLSSDQLQESWIICKLKSFSPLNLHDLNTQDRRVIFGVSKTLCDFSHKKFFYRTIN